MILTDNETKVDLLNNEAIAKTIVGLLRERPEHPVTIGVHGDWGAGKSSVLEMIESTLDGDKEIVCLKFNGWRFQGFEDAKIALLEGIVTGLIEERSMLTNAGEAVKEIFKRINWLKIARSAGGLAITAFTGIPTPEQIGIILDRLKTMAADPGKLATPENYEKVIGSVAGLLKPAEPKNVPEEIQEFRKAFDELLDKAGIEQLIVLVDDLDRCLPDTAIETLEAIRLFVFTPRTAFVVAADEAMIEYSVRKHFPELPDTTGPRDYARNYLEKLIQVPFRLPALGETETRIYVTLLLIGSQVAEADSSYSKLVETARTHLQRPWQSQGLSSEDVKAAFGSRFPEVQGALTLSDQIGPLLASGTQGNPRQIKRFVNSLLLRQQTADARGFGSEIQRPVLAKLMLAERFMTRFFEQVATAAARNDQGRCEDLAELERGSPAPSAANAASLEKPGKTEVTGASSPSAPESATLVEWRASEAIREWARLSPPLASVDLRPYLFVAKDRKDYFGAASVLGHLGMVVEQLTGPKLAVRAMESQLKQLAPLEASKVFEALRGRVMGADSFQTQPPGVEGMTSLTRTHPALQSMLMDFLESLPEDKTGAWAVSGWDGVIKDPGEVRRLAKLLDDWSKTGQPVLKVAATTASRTRGKR
jgi:predicted KAP-like P-loop ATPase